MPVKTADKSPMKIDGRFATNFSVKDRITRETIQEKGLCYVTESTNLLKLEWCIQLPAYKELKEKYHCRMVAQGESQRAEVIADLKKQFAEDFKCELGRCTKTKAKLMLKDNAAPVFKKKRPVPYASVPDMDEEINRLVAEGVISPVDHSEWAAPIVQIIDAMICGLEGVAAYLDDVIVTGRTDAEHRQNLEALFRRIQEYGSHVPMEKCTFLMPQIRYVGCITDKDGRRPDPDKTE
ncbi:hypothetical protein OESDEN_22839, partial [Oesophagostomum dentatum]